MESDLMAPTDLATKLGKSQAALAQWRYLGIGPPFIKLGRNVRYRTRDVEAWLDRQTMQRTGDPAGGAA
ncbi:helix-turn-helix transcriptional regulator [Pseudarthrobacter sp. ATCC 49987]|uniref:helix-turn-helix transcriptional regulator n=1 Tax=Pseudarthrobacter sp. ATCC 49987 TaxID=2698204 RepID=UPI0013707360|nr:helix-turn-helix domain-containing protein [Pseudarthrobacter sp. ATCC 49987]